MDRTRNATDLEAKWAVAVVRHAVSNGTFDAINTDLFFMPELAEMLESIPRPVEVFVDEAMSDG